MRIKESERFMGRTPVGGICRFVLPRYLHELQSMLLYVRVLKKGAGYELENN